VIGLLVSVRSVAEARLAAAGGADFIDLKEPRAGALGGLPLGTISDIVRALRATPGRWSISATIGDQAMDDLPEMLRRARAVAACGVDHVKVGILAGPGAVAAIDALAATGRSLIPVFIADAGLDQDLIRRAAHSGRFAALMIDTAAKLAGSLLDRVPAAELRGFIAAGRATGTPVGLAGALGLSDLPALAALMPDFAGFRSAVCAGDRGASLDPGLLRGLAEGLRRAVAGLDR